MANARRVRYADGSLAYDFNNPALYPDYDQEFTAPAPERRTVPKAKPKTRAVPRGKQSIAPFSIVGFACAAVLLVFALMAQIQLTTVSEDTVVLQSRLEELQLEEAKLKIAYESAFNLTEIEDYAVNVLGMQKPRSDQIFHIDGSAPDKAVIHTGESEEGGFTERVAGLLAGIGELIG